MKKQWILVLITMGSLSANPSGGQKISGDVTFHVHGKKLEIRASDQSVIHWDDFSIDAGELAKFIQPSSSATVLNKVLGLNPSLINGMLKANGKVILINPQGVIVGKEGVIRTASFIASTLDQISTSSEGIRFEGDSTAAIINYGTITTELGDVVLIATTIENNGTIDPLHGKAIMGGGSDVLLSHISDERLFIRPSLSSGSVTNNGLISAAEVAIKTQGSAYALALNEGSRIQATGVVESNGRILLVAEGGSLNINGELASSQGHIELRGGRVALLEKADVDVSSDTGGGVVLIGTQQHNPSHIYSDAVYIDPKARIKADALVQGDGGKVIVQSENSTEAFGLISGRGGPLGGNGGFVELSSRNYLAPRSFADLTAPAGKSGLLYIDPCDVIISTAAQSPGVVFNYPTASTLPSQPTIINNSALSTQLTASSVFINTDVGSGGTGNMTITAPVTWNTPNTLQLNATQDLTINNTVECTGITGIGDIILSTDVGDILVTAVGIGNAAQVSTSGNVTMTANGSVTIQAGSTPMGENALVQGNTVAITATTGNFNLDSSQTSPATAIVETTVSVGGATCGLVIDVPNGNINITTDNGGYTQLNSSWGISATAGGDFLITNSDTTLSGTQNTYILYVNGPPSGSQFTASTFNCNALAGGVYEFDQQNSPTTFTSTLDFLMTTQGTSSMLITGLSRAGEPVIMNIGRDLILSLEGSTTLEFLCNSSCTVNAGRDIQLLNTGDKGILAIFSGDSVSATAGRNIYLDKVSGLVQGMGKDVAILATENLTLNAGNDITVGILSTLAAVDAQILAIANQNIIMTDPTSLIAITMPSAKTGITLVVDNQDPTSPNAGNGQFNMIAGSIDSGGGSSLLRIYTSLRSQNTVNGDINGAPFVPGALGVNTPIEEWSTWYPGGYAPTAPDFYTFYYKQIFATPTNPTTTTTPFVIPGKVFADVSQILGNLYDDIEIFQYDLPPYKNHFCLHYQNYNPHPRSSSLKFGFLSRVWVDRQGDFFKRDWCDFVQIDNYHKYYLNRQRVIPFYVGQEPDVD